MTITGRIYNIARRVCNFIAGKEEEKEWLKLKMLQLGRMKNYFCLMYLMYEQWRYIFNNDK